MILFWQAHKQIYIYCISSFLQIRKDIKYNLNKREQMTNNPGLNQGKDEDNIDRIIYSDSG